MSDGRIFTDWRSPALTNAELAARAGVLPGTYQFIEMLQNSHGAQTQTGEIGRKTETGDAWGINYAPPPPKELLVADAREGTMLMETGAPGGFGVERSGRGWVKADSRGALSQNPDTPLSVCAPMSVRAPGWAVTPETMILNLRATSGGGTLSMAWLDGTRRA